MLNLQIIYIFVDIKPYLNHQIFKFKFPVDTNEGAL